MKIDEYFIKIPNKILISVIVSYFIMICSFLNKVYFINEIQITKLEISIIVILMIFLIYLILIKLFKKEVFKKLYLIFVIILTIGLSTNELVQIYKNVLFHDFFYEYTYRIKGIYSNGMLSFNILKREIDTKMKQDENIKPIDGKINLIMGRKLELFDLINTGLSEQEDDLIWSNKRMVQIPLYIKSEINKGDVVFHCLPYRGQTVEVYANNKYINTYQICSETDLNVPFEKSSGSDVVVIKFNLPNAKKSPKEVEGTSTDDRKLGLAFKSISIEEK